MVTKMFRGERVRMAVPTKEKKAGKKPDKGRMKEVWARLDWRRK